MLTDEEIMAQVFAAFQEEQAEHRQRAGELLLELERDPAHPQRQALLDQLFREAHSLKGGARAAGQLEIEQLAHRIEDVISEARKGKLQLTPDVCDPIYAALDDIGVIMSQVVAQQPVDFSIYQPLLAKLSAIVADLSPAPDSVAEERPTALPEPVPPPESLAVPPVVNGVMHDGEHDKHETEAHPIIAENKLRSAENGVRTGEDGRGDLLWAEMTTSTVRLSTATLDGLLNEAGELMTCTIRARQHAREINELAGLPTRWRRIWRQAQPSIARLKSRAPTMRPTVHHLRDRGEVGFSGTTTPGNQDTAVLLDLLAQANTLIGELEGLLNRGARRASEDYARLAAVTDRMHSQVRRTRMLPVTTLLNPLRLQLRDMARAAGKQILLELDDGGAEADRQVLERLREVLLHLLRNAVDHGIEPPNVRIACGKTPTGCIALRAAVSGDHLTLTLEDDGAGLDLDAIKHHAFSIGLLSETDATRVSANELADLIFIPGFSTRKTVNELSGRGVGLDIVRSNVERMNGRVTVQSIPGAGTTFILNVPLSLTSSHGLLLQVNKANYVLPLDAVQRIIQTTPAAVQMLEGRATLVVDQRPLALVRLVDLLGQGERAAGGNGVVSAQGLALILGSGERQIACLVDGVLGEQELVVHRLPAPLQRVRFIAGATIMADGKVIPILDVVDIVRAAIGTRRSVTLTPAPVESHRTSTVLVVDDSITTRTLEKNILEAAGYRVCLATDGVEALELLRTLADDGGCDLLLSDIDMPRLNGFDLTTKVRADLHFQHLPVVLVTSLDTAADRERGIAAGADAYIVKRTFDQQVLLDTIAQLL